MIRKYRASTFTEAFLRIKEDLGPDAVILKQQEIKHSPNPNEKVEVTVTLDDIDELPPPMPKPGDAGQAIGAYNHKGIKPVDWRNLEKPVDHRIPPKKERLPSSDSIDKINGVMENVMAEIKKLREEFAVTRNEFLEGIRVVRDRIPKEFAPIATLLFKNGLPMQTVQDLLAEVMLLCPISSRDEVAVKEQMAKVIANRILIASRPRLRKGRPLVQMFIGPAGAGKSGIISKLAGRATVTGNPNVAIVTTDSYRMGAFEQMESFAAAADIELQRVSYHEEVPDVFEKLRDKSLILVDTAGRNPQNEEHEYEINALYEAIRPDEMHLVLPLNMRDCDLENAVEVYANLKVNRLVFTRQDESYEQGALLWLPVKYGIPLSYIGNGQSPDNIVSAEKDIIASWLLR